MSDAAGSIAPAARLLRLLGGKWVAAALSAAATLRIPDALVDGPLSLDALVERTGCDRPSLERLLRVLCGEGILVRGDDGGYALTDEGRCLCADELGALARFVGAPVGWNPWSRLPESVRSGEAAFEKQYGLGLFDYLEQSENAAEAELYHAAIDSFTRRESAALASAFDFSGVKRIADIGGGRGRLLVDVLERWPHLEGVLLERPSVAESARSVIAEAGLSGRCEVRDGDFFDELPRGVDLCILKHIVHSWDDETSTRILERCAEIVGREGYVLLIEGLRLPGGLASLTSLMDLEMLVLCGPGHERSKPEMRRLIQGAGLRLERSQGLTESARLFVTRPRGE